MANVTISDLPLAITPLDGPNTFFEVQTIESGVQVSRKVSADNIVVGGGVPDGTDEGTMLRWDNTGLTYEVADRVRDLTAGTTFGGTDFGLSGMTMRGRFNNAGQSGGVTQTVFTLNDADISSPNALGELGFNSTGIATDGDTLYLYNRREGGPVEIWYEDASSNILQAVQHDPDVGTHTFYGGNAGLTLFTLTAQGEPFNSGFQIQQTGANCNVIFAENVSPVTANATTTFNAVTADGTNRDFLQAISATDGSATTNISAPTDQVGAHELQLFEESADVIAILGTGFPTSFGVVGTNSDGARLRVGHPNAGTAGVGIEAGNDSGGPNDETSYIRQLEKTGGDWTNTTKDWIRFERDASVVLLENDAVAMETSPSGINVYHPTASAPAITFLDSGSGLRGVIQFDAAESLIRGLNNGLPFRLEQEDAGGTVRRILEGDPDGDLELHHPDTGVIIARSVVPTSGGLEVDNQSTGAGFERVLTTSDLGGGVSFPIDANDNDQIRWGTGQDVSQFFDGTDMRFDAVDGVSYLWIGGSGGTENMLGLIANGGMLGYFNGNQRFEITDLGLEVRGSVATATPPTNENVNSRLVLQDSAGNDDLAFLGFNTNPTFRVQSNMQGENLQIRGENAAGVTRIYMEFDPGTNPARNVIYHCSRNDIVMFTQDQGIGLRGSSNNDPTAGGTQNTSILFDNDSDVQHGRIAWDSSADMGIVNQVHGGNMVLQGESGAGAVRTLFLADPDGAGLFGYQAGTNVGRTTTAAAGGLEANNTLTGAGFERVLTTSDLPAASNLTVVYKTSTETINSDATLSADTDLNLSITANERYACEMFFSLTTPAAADFQWDFTGPAGFTIRGQYYDDVNDLLGQFTEATDIVIASASGATVHYVRIVAQVFATATGTMNFRWAQDTSNAGNTNLLVGGWLQVRQLS